MSVQGIRPQQMVPPSTAGFYKTTVEGDFVVVVKIITPLQRLAPQNQANARLMSKVDNTKCTNN